MVIMTFLNQDISKTAMIFKLGKVEGAYCFGLVRASVRPCVRSKFIRIQFLKFHILIPHQKLIDMYF